MSSFIDTGDVPDGKVDIHPLPSGANPNNYVIDSDWNELCQISLDLRTQLIAATFVGLTPQASAPTLPGDASTTFVWSKSTDGGLYYRYAGGTDYRLLTTADLSIAAFFNQTLQANTVNVAQRSKLNFSSRFALTDSAGSDRSTVDLAIINSAPGSYTHATVTVDQWGRCSVVTAGTAYNSRIQSNGVNVTQRNNLNFTSRFTLTDSSGSDRTTVDMAVVNSSPGSFTLPAITVDAYGRVTTATTTGGGVLSTRRVDTSAGLSGGGDLSANRTLVLDQAYSPTWTGTHTFNGRLISKGVKLSDQSATRQVIYVRNAGDDVLGDGTTSVTAYATIARALQDVESLAYNINYVIELTGYTADIADLQLPFLNSQNAVGGTSPDFNVFTSEAYLNFEAVPTTLVTLNSGTVTTDKRPVDRLLLITDSSQSWTPDQYAGKHVYTPDGDIAVIITNDATTLTCTCNEVSPFFTTTDVQIVDLSCVITTPDGAGSSIIVGDTDSDVHFYGISFKVTHEDTQDSVDIYNCQRITAFTACELQSSFSGPDQEVDLYAVNAHATDGFLALQAVNSTTVSNCWFHDYSTLSIVNGGASSASLYACAIHLPNTDSFVCSGGTLLQYIWFNTNVTLNTTGFNSIYHCSFNDVTGGTDQAAITADGPVFLALDYTHGTPITGYGIRLKNGAKVAVGSIDNELVGSLGEIKVGNLATRTFSDFFNVAPIGNQFDNGFDSSRMYKVGTTALTDWSGNPISNVSNPLDFPGIATPGTNPAVNAARFYYKLSDAGFYYLDHSGVEHIVGVVGANPSATVGLTAVNGSATTYLRSDGAPALDQSIAPTWTGLHTWNSGTTSGDVVLLEMAQPGSSGTRDSHWLQIRGTSYDSSGHNADWKQFVNVTSNAGASTWKLQSRIDSGTFTTRFSVTDAGNGTFVGTVGASNLSGTNTGDVTLAGENYLSLSSQVITANAVSLSGSNVTNTLPVTRGGTGQVSYTDGQLLIGNTSGNTLTKATLTAGTGVTVTNGNGSISVAVDTTVIATRAYVDATAQGLSIKDSVLALSDSNIASLLGGITIDGIIVPNGSRVLLTGQTTASQNGLWVTALLGWSRPADFATGSHASGAFTFVEQGTSYGGSGWVCDIDPAADVVDTNNLTFAQFSGAGEITAGTGLSKTGNTLYIASSAITTSLIANSNITLAKIADIADQTILGNNTGGSAAPIALTASQIVGIIGSSITTVGTVTTGTWSATTIAVNKGGTGQTSYTDGQLLIGNTSGNTLTKAALTAGTGITVTNGNGSISLAVDQSFSPTWSGNHTFSNNVVHSADATFSGAADHNIYVSQQPSVGSNGHNLLVYSGAGAAADASNDGGSGGATSVIGGTGGAGSAAKSPGPGNVVNVLGGDAGAVGGFGGNANGGGVVIDAGARRNSGSLGTILIGATVAGQITLGRSGQTVSVQGSTTFGQNVDASGVTITASVLNATTLAQVGSGGTFSIAGTMISNLTFDQSGAPGILMAAAAAHTASNNLTITAGAGGVGNASNDGGAGGAYIGSGGAGGVGSGAKDPGAGGGAQLLGGNAGTGGTGNASSGGVVVDSGTPQGTGTAGSVLIGATVATAVTVGRATKTLTLPGVVAVTGTARFTSYTDYIGSSTPGSNPASDTARLFYKTGDIGFYYLDSAGAEHQVGAAFANPTASAGLSAVNGSASTAMRSDAAPAISQSITPTWTGLHTHNSGTTSANLILLDMAQPNSNGTRDSHWLTLRGTSYDGSGHNADWKFLNNVTSNAGASTLKVMYSLDGAAFASKLTVTSTGNLVATGTGTFTGNLQGTTVIGTSSGKFDAIDANNSDTTLSLGSTNLAGVTITPKVSTTGAAGIRLNGPAHTHLAASNEYNDVYFNLTRTVSFDGSVTPVTANRTILIGQPTYAGSGTGGAATITDAATIYIQGAPVQGSNMTLTRTYALWQAAGIFRNDGYMDLTEASAPGTPPALTLRFYCRSNGSASPNQKTQFVAKDSSGNIIVIAEGTAV